MKGLVVRASALALLVSLATPVAAPRLARADENATMAGSAVKADIMTWLKDAEDKLTQLAEATPERKYSYRPGKGVRSTGEVFLHVAAANYRIPSFAGVKPPDGLDLDTFEKSMTRKADIVKALKASFDHVNAALANTSDADMVREIDVFGTKRSVRSMYLLVLSHNHEHLGQSIAYARVNGIVPPWTAAQQQRMAENPKPKTTSGAKTPAKPVTKK